MDRIELNAGWKVVEAPLDWGKEQLEAAAAREAEGMPAQLPCDVHTPLEQAGRIRDVVRADYCFEAEWIERRSWWFFKHFSGGEVDLTADVIELTLESLDACAEVFLNGQWLGGHRSAHFPFVAGIKGRVRPGDNLLAVRLTTGLEQVSDQDLAEINWAVCHEEGNGCPERGDRRRAFVRKPQYAIGWDWGPKAVTCGIVKGAFIQCHHKTAIRGAHLTTRRAGRDALVGLELTVDQLDIIATKDADVEVTLSLDGRPCAHLLERDILLTSGLNYLDFELELKDAQLWWPSGYGAQPLYTVEVTVSCEGHCTRLEPFEFGVRTIELDTSRTGPDTRAFALKVNGVPIFCKGGDWIPADSVYARVSAEKYQALVAEAREANFNMLRVWGGGLYERDEFYQACDRMGILLWHDFMFGCASYPDHLDWFRALVDRELDYQTRRLRNHACLALWCGNNEDHWIFNALDNPQWNIDICYEKQYGLYTANVQAKRAVRANCPEIPYWNSSPYGGERPNADGVGDVHHWHSCMMNPEMAKRIEPKEYDKVMSRFVTEYGYPGPCSMASIADYFDGAPIDRTSRVWEMHNNTFEKKTVAAGIEKHYLDGAAQLSLEDYILYAGMVQSTMLGYSLEALRFKDFCAGALFWMYNDTWGEVGWTIVDYYLRRKISFYGVKRAFEPIKLMMRVVDGQLVVMGANDTDQEVELSEAQLGYLSLDGSERRLSSLPIRLEPRSRSCLYRGALPEGDLLKGLVVLITGDARVEPAALRQHDLRALKRSPAQVQVLSEVREGDDVLVTLTAPVYVHGVHLPGELKCSDNYFDLLPGQVKLVRVESAQLLPQWRAIP